MRPLLPVVSSVSLLLFVACDRKSADGDSGGQADQGKAGGEAGEAGEAGADDKKPATGDEPPETGEAGEPKSLEAARKELRERQADDPEGGKKAGESLLKLVNEGRKLVKETRYDEGIAKYEAALAIDPNYRPALGELGWAEFNAEHYDRAHAHSLRALDLAETDKQRGMYLYNLGRIAEAQGNEDEAIARYQVSVDKRPNRVVQARLGELLAKTDGPVLDATTTRGLDVLATVSTETELCDAVAKHGYCSTDEQCVIDSRPAGDPETFGLLFSGDVIFGCYHPVLHTDAGYALLEAVTLSQYGSEIVQGVEDVQSTIETHPSGAYWVLRIKDGAEGRGWGDEVDPETIFFEAEKVVVCHLDASGPSCTHPITAEFKGDGGQGSMSYSATVTLVDGAILVDGVTSSGIELNALDDEVEADGSLFLPEGRHAFRELASRPSPMDEQNGE